MKNPLTRMQKISFIHKLAGSVLFLIFFAQSIFGGGFQIAQIDTARKGMVVAGHPGAAAIGVQILKQGGNAVDAAVATAFAIGVLEPFASGLGGGGGMLIYLKEKDRFSYLDYYVQAPQNADTAFNRDKERGTPRAICIPGTPSGLITAVHRYGRLSLKQDLAPAIHIAREGVVVNDFFYEAVLEKLDVIMKYPQTSRIFLNDGLPYMKGDTVRFTGLLTVLEKLAEDGEEYFYRGEFAQKAANAIRRDGGYITAADFAGYHTLVKEPVSIDYRGYRVVSSPPPQSGITVLEILNILENLPSKRFHPFQHSVASLFLTAEAMLRADVDRFTYLADPRFVPVPVSGLLSDQFARQRFQDIDTSRVKYTDKFDIPPGDPWKFSSPSEKQKHFQNRDSGPHTTHISVIDADGNMVSLTQTLGFFFGCGFSEEGVIFNSSMSVFYPGSINKIEPGKRPTSTISPTIILKGNQPFAILGTPGGRNIFNTMSQVIMRLIDLGESPAEAVDAPRFSARISSKKVTLEGRFTKNIVKKIKQRGYKIRLTNDYEIYLGGVQLIYYDAGLQRYIGVSDPRRGGGAVGYD